MAEIKLDKKAEARKNFTRAIHYNPIYPKPHHQLGTMDREEEKYSEAIEHFKAVLNTYPDDLSVQKQIYECEKLDKEKMEQMKN